MDVFLVFLMLLSMLPIVTGLKCFNCSSLIDKRCGLEWVFKEGEADMYLEECKEKHTTCQKIVGELQGNGDQHIYRKCWKQTTVENYTPYGCEEQYITGTVICHCSQDACNGSDVICPSIVVMFSSSLLFYFRLFVGVSGLL